jgi:hypothetical protein
MTTAKEESSGILSLCTIEMSTDQDEVAQPAPEPPYSPTTVDTRELRSELEQSSQQYSPTTVGTQAPQASQEQPQESERTGHTEPESIDLTNTSSEDEGKKGEKNDGLWDYSDDE